MAVPPSDGLLVLAKIPHRPLVPQDPREVQTLLHEIAAEQRKVAGQIGDIQATQRDQGKQIDALIAANSDRVKADIERDRKLSDLHVDRRVFMIGVKAFWVFMTFVFAVTAWLFGPDTASRFRHALGL